MWVLRNTWNGSENEWGICPEDRPGRGSGSVPRKLHVIVGEDTVMCGGVTMAYRPRERASTTSSAAGSDAGSRSELATTCS